MQRWIRIATALVGLLAAQADAADLIYRWTGQLVRLDAASADPWGVGLGGAAFEIEAMLSSTAVDLNPTQNSFAVFDALSLRLWVNGVEETSVEPGIVDFQDVSSDLVSATGRFRLQGVSLNFATTAALPPSSFALSAPSVTPPTFASRFTLTRASSGGGPYASIVPVGTYVSTVAEPGSGSQGAFAVLASVATGSWRPRRRP